MSVETDGVPIKEHFEVRFDAHEQVHAQEAMARQEAKERIDSRLRDLNELRAEVLTDRNRLVNQDVFNARIEALQKEINTKDDSMGRRVDLLHDQITEWKGRNKGLSLAASMVVSGVAFISTVLAIYFALSG